MILTDLYIKDFLSFNTAHIQFPTTGLVLVTGWDEDLGRSNGAGKSSLFQAISWCLYGELPRDMKVDELIRRGQTSCMVAVRFKVDSQEYMVTRKRPSGLDVTVGKEKLKGNPKFLQAFVEQTIGYSYKQFLITAFFPQKGDSSRFIKQNDAMAKDLLGTILNFNKTEAAYKKLHLEIKELEKAVAAKSSEVSTLENALEKMEYIAKLPIPDMPNRDDVLAAKEEHNRLQLETKTLPDTSAVDAEIRKISAAIERVKEAKYSVRSSQSMIDTMKRQITHIQSADTHTLTCPSCSADLLEIEGKLVEFDESNAQEQKAARIASLEKSISNSQLTIDSMKHLLNKEEPLLKKLNEANTRRLEMRHGYDMAMQKKSHIESQMAHYRQAILAAQQAKKQKDEIASQIEEFRQSIAAKVIELKSLEEELMIKSAAKSVMSPTGAIAYSLDGIMSDLNDEVTQYLDIFSHGTMTYKVSSGEDKAKVTHSITKGGTDVSVGSLSGGEERGLILSVDLGLAEVIATRSGVSLPSILMLDECFEGLDFVGKEKVLDALREISVNRCIIVIDHSTEFNALFDQSIRVVKKNEISRLEVS